MERECVGVCIVGAFQIVISIKAGETSVYQMYLKYCNNPTLAHAQGSGALEQASKLQLHLMFVCVKTTTTKCTHYFIFLCFVFKDASWGDNGVLLFEPHTRPITRMMFSRSRPSTLITTSYDGAARAGDIEKAVFEEV